MRRSSASAGVYVKEIDLSQRVAAVSSSIGAIVGASNRGPVGKRVLVTSKRQFLEIFGEPDPSVSYMHYAALEFLSKSKALWVTRVVNTNESRGALPLTAGAFVTIDDVTADAPVVRINNFDDSDDPTSPTANPKGKYDPYNTYTFNPNQPGIKNILFMVSVENPGKWNNGLYIRIKPDLKDGTDILDDRYDDSRKFWIEVYENYKSTRQAPLERHFVSLALGVDGYGQQTQLEEVVNNSSSLIRVRLNPYAVSDQVKITNECSVFLAGATGGGRITKGQVQQAWELYRDPEKVDVNILIQAGAPVGISSVTDISDIQATMVDIAEDRMDCVAVLDVPSLHQRFDKAIAYVKEQLNVDSSYGAIYSPDVRIYDEYNDIEIFVAPSGFAASAMAFTDTNAELWFAPAGMVRGDLNVQDARFIYEEGERNALHDAHINAIRYFSDGSGFKIWDAETLQTMASALSNINVRRLMCFIEKSLAIALQYSIFNPNDSTLWTRTEDLIRKFLAPIERGRGLYWFDVVCDESNNPPDSIANGDTVVDVYVDPVIPAKRIKLNAILNKTGSRSTVSG